MKLNIERFYKDWINESVNKSSKSNLDLLSDKSLINDLRNYNVTSKTKAFRVYNKCIKAGKLKLADKIYKKYNLKTNDDIILAHCLTLIK